MTLTAEWTYRDLQFKTPSGTSRGILKSKRSYYIKITDAQGKVGIGECGLLKGLSIDFEPAYEQCLNWVCANIHAVHPDKLVTFPSIRFGLEMAFMSLQQKNKFELFPSAFTQGKESMRINGLIWMGSFEFMSSQIKTKIAEGFNCIKLKIGAIDFEQELSLIKQIRKEYTPQDIEIRVDANGGFDASDALKKLDMLAACQLHSIEQPIKQKQWEEMAVLCEKSALPIALDEELIGVHTETKQELLLDSINPHYLIFKPSLLGGFTATNQWINHCQKRNIGWWITSALESNIGLNAIAQYTYTLNNTMPQGLGTGKLYTNNIDSPLTVEKGHISYQPNQSWSLLDNLFNQ